MEFYAGNKKFSYVENNDLLTFCEVKNFNPFPELLFNFIGTLNELRNSHITRKQKTLTPVHIAPSLMISGIPNEHAKKIKESLETRYCLNIICDLFSPMKNPFFAHRTGELKTIKAN